MGNPQHQYVHTYHNDVLYYGEIAIVWDIESDMKPRFRAGDGTEYEISVGSNTIGSGRDRIRVVGGGVKQEHAIVECKLNHELTITPLGGDVLLNGTALKRLQRLSNGDRIQLGDIVLSVVVPVANANSPNSSGTPTPPLPSPFAPSPPLPPPFAPTGGKTPEPYKPSRPSPVPSPTPPTGIVFPSTINGRVPQLQGKILNVTERKEPKRSSMSSGCARAGFFIMLMPLAMVPFVSSIMGPILTGLSIRQPQQASVYYIRVAAINPSREFNVKAVGDFVSGNLSLGDSVSFFGKDQNGSLIMDWCYNHTLEAFVYMQGDIGDIVMRWIGRAMLAFVVYWIIWLILASLRIL